MSLITHVELMDLVRTGVIKNADPQNVNGASIDVRLGETMRVEHRQTGEVNLALGETVRMRKVPLNKKGCWTLPPGGFALFETMETFDLPDDIAVEFKLRSSMARSGIDHALAGWADPGWHNSTLTMELRNNLSYTRLMLAPGLRIGQIVFWRGDPVPGVASYRSKGRYNNQSGAQGSKGHGD
jgi:dCTP deaminase